MSEIINGEAWMPYSIEFESDGRPYRTSLMARSFGEAQVMLSDLKETGFLVGEIVGSYEADKLVEGGE